MASFVLEILDGDRAGETVSLGGSTLRIGRKLGNDLVLADEKTSGVHAEVVCDGGRYVLRDLGSTNGTTMDGRRITEVVLGHGDSFTIGRVRIQFRDASAPSTAAAEASTKGVEVASLDLGRLKAAQGKGRSAATLGLVGVLALAVGGWFWMQSRGTGGEDGGSPSGPRAILEVAGNRLEGGTGACENDAGWNLRVAGSTFQSGASAHTGQSALEAQRSTEGQDFAVASTAAEIRVLPGRSMLAQAHLRTIGAARAALRVVFWSSVDASVFRFRVGTPLSAHDGWQRVEVAAATPPGCDRCAVEVVALLPDESSRAQCDDVALTESGAGQAVETKVGENGAVLGVGSSLAVRSMDKDDPAVLLWILPADVAPELRGLHAADLLTLSDVGGSVEVATDEIGAQFIVAGCEKVELGFPIDSGSGMLADSGSGFVGMEAGSSTTATRVLLGDRSTRCMIETKEPASMQGRAAGGVFRLQLGANSWRMQLGFRQERQDARERLRAAEALAEAEPGKALGAIREALATSPHDAETSALLATLRGGLQQRAQDRLQQLAKDLDEAEFFETRGGFQRIVAEIQRLVGSYGEEHMPDAKGALAMLARAQERLAQLDGQRAQDARARLTAMAKAFEEAQQPGLAKLVRDYVAQRFSKQE